MALGKVAAQVEGPWRSPPLALSAGPLPQLGSKSSFTGPGCRVSVSVTRVIFRADPCWP